VERRRGKTRIFGNKGFFSRQGEARRGWARHGEARQGKASFLFEISEKDAGSSGWKCFVVFRRML